MMSRKLGEQLFMMKPSHQRTLSPREQRPSRAAAISRSRKNSGSNDSKTVSTSVELTRAQQLDVQRAREATVSSLTKSTPQAAKKFVESISLDVDLETTRQLTLSKKSFSSLPSSIGTLCRQLKKLDLANNALTDLSPLATLQHLSNLNVAHNDRLASLKGLAGTCLSVLNVSFCAVDSLEGLTHSAITLRTFIANDNRIQLQSDRLALTDAMIQDDQGEARSLAAYLPESLCSSIAQNAVAQRNFAILASFQKCETVVLSRNPHLCDLFPSWSPERMVEVCGGEVSGDAAAEEDEDDADDTNTDTSGLLEDDGAGTRSKHLRQSVTPGAVKKNVSGAKNAATTDRPGNSTGNAAELEEYHLRRQALAAAHPLSVFERMPRLKKLSLSGCELHSLPMRWFLPMVTELRLAQNHLTSLQPCGVILRSLHILDVSHNIFLSVTSMRRCRFLEQLNVRGNPLIDVGVGADEAAGLSRKAEPSTDAVATLPSSNPAVLPVTVQQEVHRLFPKMKILDGQPIMTPDQVAEAYKQAQRATTSVAQRKRAIKDEESAMPQEEDADSRLSAPTGDEVKAPRSLVKVARAPPEDTSAPVQKARRVDAVTIAAEADEKDVVLEVPRSVIRTAHAPIVRRERVLLRQDGTVANARGAAKTAAMQRRKEGKGGLATAPSGVTYGQAAVEQLLHQHRHTSAW